MKRHVGDFFRRCLTCQRVKAEHQKPAGLLQPLEVAKWKWEHVTMDFMTHLPRTLQRHDAVWVIVDRLMKSYADVRRRPLEFEVGDHVFLKVMPKRGVVRFGKRGRLSPRFIGPFEILERVGTEAYRLALPPSMSGVHEVFHVSMLRRYTLDPAHVVDWREIEVDTNETFKEGPVCIMDSRDQVLRRKTVKIVRVLWQHRGVEESTWELEDTMRATYPFLFKDEGTWFSRLILK